MSDFYLGNGNKRPKLEDYKRAFGVNAQMVYTLDKIRYEQNCRAVKEARENNKKASKHCAVLDCGILSTVKSSKVGRQSKTIKKGVKK